MHTINKQLHVVSKAAACSVVDDFRNLEAPLNIMLQMFDGRI